MDNNRTLYIILALLGVLIVCLIVVLVMFFIYVRPQLTGETSQTETAVVQETGAVLTLTAQTTISVTPTLSPSGTPPPTATIPSTAVPPTATSGAPTITANVATNCRMGNTTDYPIVGALQPGQTSAVVGRDAAVQWWYIKNPDNPTTDCWVWGQTTTVSGDTSGLPVVDPPPLPTPEETPIASFNANFAGVHDCGGQLTAIFSVKNNGDIALESMSITIVDITADQTLFGPATSNAPFMGSASECPPGGDTLPPGASGFVGGSLGPGAPIGNQIEATITLCSENDLVGGCSTDNVQFNIPLL